MSLAKTFESGLSALDLALSADVQHKMLEYLTLLAKWNKVHNLTAVRDKEEMVTLHLLDSLAVLPYIEKDNLLDVGSGAGLPGIPIALAKPEIQVTVIDSSHKKTSFLRQAKVELGIANLDVVCDRVESYRSDAGFNTIISRAFSDLSEFVRLTQHLLATDGSWLAMKGVYPYDELSQLNDIDAKVLPLTIPGLDVQRHLVALNRKSTL